MTFIKKVLLLCCLESRERRSSQVQPVSFSGSSQVSLELPTPPNMLLNQWPFEDDSDRSVAVLVVGTQRQRGGGPVPLAHSVFLLINSADPRLTFESSNSPSFSKSSLGCIERVQFSSGYTVPIYL